jgi:uncharacterized protein YndB with AHSA1/START domain
VKPERRVYEHSDDNGRDIFQSTVTFVAQGSKTKVTLRARFPSKAARDTAAKYAIDGGNQTLARLDQHLATMSAG